MPEVIAFVGASGTGKSYRAINVAYTEKCDGIIDDGILIQNTKILAGFSAKNAKNPIQAVKRAIFDADEHALEVRQALAKSNIRRLLILATSDRMIKKICNRLGLADPVKTVYIENVATEDEIKEAKHIRLMKGKHVVPVPNVELKPHFSGYFADLPLNVFSSFENEKEKPREYESIVRPDFSFFGKLLIGNNVIRDIISILVQEKEFADVDCVTDISTRRRFDSSRGVIIMVEVILFYGSGLQELICALQKKIKEVVEAMTGMQVTAVDISIRSLKVHSKV